MILTCLTLLVAIKSFTSLEISLIIALDIWITIAIIVTIVVTTIVILNAGVNTNELGKVNSGALLNMNITSWTLMNF